MDPGFRRDDGKLLKMQEKTMTSSVDVIAARLYAAGCRHAFGIPGGEVLAMMETLEHEVSEAFARQGFTLIEVPVERKAYDGRF